MGRGYAGVANRPIDLVSKHLSNPTNGKLVCPVPSSCLADVISSYERGNGSNEEIPDGAREAGRIPLVESKNVSLNIDEVRCIRPLSRGELPRDDNVALDP